MGSEVRSSVKSSVKSSVGTVTGGGRGPCMPLPTRTRKKGGGGEGGEGGEAVACGSVPQVMVVACPPRLISNKKRAGGRAGGAGGAGGAGRAEGRGGGGTGGLRISTMHG